jgi:GLPGLI family protein
MKNLLQPFLILLLFSNISISQNQKKLFVEYDVNDGAFSYKANLIAANGKAIYFHDKSKQRKGQKPLTIVSKFNSVISDTSAVRSGRRYYTKQNDSEIAFTQFYKNKMYLINDKVPDVFWMIEPESQKKIHNFTCTKAVGQFRGSEIVVYFTTDLPLPFGPWKFKGLPGVILEAYVANDKQNYSFTVSKVIYPHKNDISLELSEKEKSFIPMSYQKFYKKRTNDFLKKLEILHARSGSKARLVSTKETRTAIEKVFEWE